MVSGCDLLPARQAHGARYRRAATDELPDGLPADASRSALSVRRVGSGFLQFVRLHVEELRFAGEADAFLFEEWH